MSPLATPAKAASPPPPTLASLMSAHFLWSIIINDVYLLVYWVVFYLHPLECQFPEGKDFILCMAISLALSAEQILNKHLISERKMDDG